MRTSFLLLLLANVAFFAYGGFSDVLFPGESQLLQQQINPEAIRLVAPAQRVGPADRVAAADRVGAAERVGPTDRVGAADRVVPVERVVAPPVSPERNAACIEWGAFSPDEAAPAAQALAPLALGSNLVRRRVEQTVAWWVFMPPQGSRAAANSKAGELQRLGVEDYFVVQDDPKFRFAISLGVFRTQGAAASRLEKLREQGVRTAQIGARESENYKIWFQVRDAPKAVVARINEFQRGFPGSQVRACARADAKKTP